MLRGFVDDGVAVAMVIAPTELAAASGTAMLDQAHRLHPQAQRLLLVGRGEWRRDHPVRRALVLGQVDSYLFVPWGLPEPWLYQPLTGALAAWSLTHPPIYEATSGTAR